MTYDLLFMLAGAGAGLFIGWGVWHKARRHLSSQREDDIRALRDMQHRISMAKTEAGMYRREPPSKN